MARVLFIDLFFQKGIDFREVRWRAVKEMIVFITQIFPEKGDDAAILNECAADERGRSRRVEPGRVVEVAMSAVLEMYPVGVMRQPIEQAPVSVAELLHERVVIAAAENEKWPVKSRYGKIVKSTVERQSGFDARFSSTGRGAGSAAK